MCTQSRYQVITFHLNNKSIICSIKKEYIRKNIENKKGRQGLDNASNQRLYACGQMNPPYDDDNDERQC